MVKSEFCVSMKNNLYHHLLEVYKEHRKTHTLVADDELYKWQLIDGCQGKDDIEQALYVLKHRRNNLMGWRVKDSVKKYIKCHQEEAKQLFANLYDEEKNVKERIGAFMATMKADAVVDERTVSVFLACHAPTKYLLYKSTYYQKLCKYLGVAVCSAGHKYEHYTLLMSPLVNLVEDDDELKQIIASEIGNFVGSPLLIAQDIVYVFRPL